MIEEWRPVPEWEDFYEVSNQGRVRTKQRLTTCSDGRVLPIPLRVRKTPIGKRGYPVVSLRACGCKFKLVPVHVLVAKAFLGPRPPKNEVRHKDGVKTNNHVDNLEWGTTSDNQNDRAKHGTSNRGERCGTSVLKEHDVRSIRELRSAGLTQRAIAEEFGISREHVRDIILGKKWSWLR